ncbi:hypothetical protein QQS21_009553 [Conoideocrella luteorostrata]|uniref:Uncharacterized protein n=1 Tax=Conoideocrella luteorostrata TaxID=1105319 RepID=A0AAJ0CGX0_9HYPO|nr:hypothetical protein QQS21_009553 [Conoideocrella luteorostrata]
MGPPRTRAHLLAQKGRFQEGSMNDRASAVPPVQFMGPSERAALERPLHLEVAGCNYGCSYGPSATPSGAGVPGATGGEEKRAGRLNIFGQMWEGVRGKLRLRRDDDKDRLRDDNKLKEYKEKARKEKDEHRGEHQDERPTRDEVFANYHQLVASGFFSSHAIQSTRHGPPRPSTSHGGDAPQWPLAAGLAVTPTKSGATTNNLSTPSHELPNAVCSPISAASSRGTKRAAAESPVESEGQDDGEDDATLAHRFLPKRLRKTAARDISLPKLRSVASRKNMRSAVAAARRSLSTGAHHAGGPQEELMDREPNKLTKKVPLSYPQFYMIQQQQQQQQGARTRASVDYVRGRDSSESYDKGSLGRKIKRPTSTRNLRSRVFAGSIPGESEPLSVVPDVNRGIPRVPHIPAKFTYGEDRENGAPWRGLRR